MSRHVEALSLVSGRSSCRSFSFTRSMKRCIFILVLMFSLAARADGQLKVKPLLKAAKTAVKNASGQDAALKNLVAVADSDAVTDAQRAQIYYLCGELQRSLNDQENLKLYLKQKYDTLKFFSTILEMHQYILKCDSVERTLGKGFKYRSKGRGTLMAFRANLLNGGKYLLKNGKDSDAFPYFDMYLRVPGEPIMAKDSAMLLADTLLTRTAFLATVAAYRYNSPQDALKHIDLAIAGADSAMKMSLTEHKANCLQMTGDSAGWFATLISGVRQYPRHDYFYLHLIDYYNAKGLYDAGLFLSDSIMRALGDRPVYWFGKSQMFLGKAEYDSCIVCSDRVIALDSTFVDAYYNKGVAYLNEAIIFSRTMDRDMTSPVGKRDRARLRGLYLYAREPMEKVRALAPDDKQRWGRLLYAIYLNLNLGDEFAEIEKLLNEE